MADDAAVVLLQLPWTTLPMDAWRHVAVALHRVWVVAVTPSRRLLTALCRRLIPSTFLPPSTRVMALQGGAQSSGGVRVDAAPEVVASVRSPPGMFSLSWAANWSSPCRTAYASDTSSIAEQPEVSNAC